MRCETCQGTGTVTLPQPEGRPFGFLALCPACRGRGSASTPTINRSDLAVRGREALGRR